MHFFLGYALGSLRLFVPGFGGLPACRARSCFLLAAGWIMDAGLAGLSLSLEQSLRGLRCASAESRSRSRRPAPPAESGVCHGPAETGKAKKKRQIWLNKSRTTTDTNVDRGRGGGTEAF